MPFSSFLPSLARTLKLFISLMMEVFSAEFGRFCSQVLAFTHSFPSHFLLILSYLSFFTTSFSSSYSSLSSTPFLSHEHTNLLLSVYADILSPVHRHREDIKKDPEFRRYFHEMCAKIGVDPLQSSKVLMITFNFHTHTLISEFRDFGPNFWDSGPFTANSAYKSYTSASVYSLTLSLSITYIHTHNFVFNFL